MSAKAHVHNEKVPSSFREVPLIDLGPFRGGNVVQKLAIARHVDSALQQVGFFYAVNHGVPKSLIRDLFGRSTEFFSLPEAEKARVSIEKSCNHRGYFALGRENVDPGATVDVKEGFDVGNDDYIEGADAGGMRGDNLWPDGQRELRRAMTAYYESMHNLARDLCRAIALAIELPEDIFDHALERPESRLRLLHYPPSSLTAAANNRMGAGAHTDCGCLTILVQDDVGGLEVQNHEGAWIPVNPIDGSFVVNIGDFMAFWSNNRYVSTRHRVVSHSSRHRYSIALFLNPNFDLEVKGFRSLTGSGEQKDRVSVSGYLRQCYDEIRS